MAATYLPDACILMPDREWNKKWIVPLHQLAVDNRMDRTALLGGIPGAVTASIQTAHNPAAQFLQDLHTLADDGFLNRPIVQWLRNAHVIARGKPSVIARIADALASLGETAPSTLPTAFAATLD